MGDPQGRRLVTVATDCDLSGHVGGWPSIERLGMRPVDHAGLLDFFQRYGFRSWRKELEGESGGTAPVVGATPDPGRTDHATPPGRPEADALALARRYETVLDRARFDDWLARLRAAEIAALDTETDSLDPMRARIVGVSFAVEPGRAAYVPLAHDYPGAPEQLPLYGKRRGHPSD